MSKSKNKKDIISVLNKLGKQRKTENTELLNKFRKELKMRGKKKKSSKEAPNNIHYRVPVRIPINITKNAKNELKELKETKKIKKIQLKEGLKKGGKLVYKPQGEKESSLGTIHVSADSKKIFNKEENFGLNIEKKGKNIDLSLHHPKTSISMRTPSHRFQGDLSYRMKLAVERMRGEKK